MDSEGIYSGIPQFMQTSVRTHYESERGFKFAGYVSHCIRYTLLAKQVRLLNKLDRAQHLG